VIAYKKMRSIEDEIKEMNPRVSRSSALASKATGFPIAKIAAKLAVGYSIDEISNDITKYTPASFEPTIDYVVVKMPRFTFEKFPQTTPTLTTQMKSVGEAMSIGRTFKESLQKAMRSLEIDSYGFENISDDPEEIREKLRIPSPRRLWYIADAFRLGMDIEEIYTISHIDPWFLRNIKQIVDFESDISRKGLDRETILGAKRRGFSDIEIARILCAEEEKVRNFRLREGIEPSFKMVDTCAAEFEAYTPYLYSTFESESEALPTERKKVVILGGGPNRIGQGIEFDYCCVHASFALREEGYEAIMVNCNPETVSTDYDTSDRLYFEPLTLEDTLAVIRREDPWGVIVHLGGQTPLRLALELEGQGVRIIGTSPESIDLAEDRDRFRKLVSGLGLLQPRSDTARSESEAIAIADEIGYPVMVRPSYVLGGRAMEIVYDKDSLRAYISEAASVSPNHPILIDKFLKDAKEVDVDAVCDGKTVVVGGVLEHIEEAGVHSGDSAAILPPFSIPPEILEEIKSQTKKLALELQVKGLVNIQFAVKDEKVYIIEVNPRASRTVPFVSKAIGVQLAKIGTKVMIGKSLEELGYTEEIVPGHYCVKESVFPFVKFPEVDTILGPEMKSTGEVMGIAHDLDQAFAKSQIAAANRLPSGGVAFISVKDEDKSTKMLDIARRFSTIGFDIIATAGTSEFLNKNGIISQMVNKVKQGRPHVVDHLKNGEVQLVINTTFGKKEIAQSYLIRRTALVNNVPYFTTLSGAIAGVSAIETLVRSDLRVEALQGYY
ncbi:MAG: carbamoyl-phosphate synthase large subunit, partial [Candidatus Dadabacteria bacterium]|nr:carbamoyl-phosphate synthase large subunit [Candidatus Dadabacteria bacterium]